MQCTLFRTLAFWATFYGTFQYARKDPETKQYVNPSYLILKQKLIKDTWKEGFNGDKFDESFKQYRQ